MTQKATVRLLLAVICSLAAAFFVALTNASFGQSQEPGAPRNNGNAKDVVAPGKYVCYDLTLVLGAGGYRYGYKYIESFTILAGGRYRREASGTPGKFRYEAATKAVVFLDGPYADVNRVGKYEPDGKSAASRLKSPNAVEEDNGQTPNIVLHKKDDESGDLDWYCSLEKQ